jgi:hypothetical protein
VVEYLFDADAVETGLGDLPTLRRKLGEPSSEGSPSLAFPVARKTTREIYRLLMARDYEHLDSLLRLLDRCLASGWMQPTLLRARGRGDFPSLVAELLVAGWLIERGFSVRSLEEGKDQEPVADLLVEHGDLVARVEVYRPRDWEGIEALLDELRLALLHLDEPYDFAFRLEIDQLRQFDGDRLVWLDPWQVSDAFEAPSRRDALVSDILTGLVAGLRGPGRRVEAVRELPEINTRLRVELDPVRSARGGLPSRRFTGGGPPLTGYASEAMFDRLLRGRVLAKARERQTRGPDDSALEVLVVDVSALGCRAEFPSPVYLDKFAASASRHLHDGNHSLDLIAFVEPLVPALNLHTHLAVLRDGLDERVADDLLGSLRHVAA